MPTPNARDALLNLLDIEDALVGHLERARIAGLEDQAQSLSLALTEISNAIDAPEPEDIRQRFFAAMLEPPRLH